ncbi:MAG: hypothetical protein WAU70_14470 [Flavobacteriales bacterium]
MSLTTTLPAGLFLLFLTGCKPTAPKKDDPSPVHAVDHIGGPETAAAWYEPMVAIDGHHKVHMLGEFSGTLAWGTTGLDGGSGNDVYLATLDENAVLERIHMIDCTGLADGAAVAVDKNDNIYILVYHNAPCLVDGNEVGSTAGSDGESFIASFAPDGTFRWLNRFESPTEVIMADLDVNADGQVVCVGRYSGSVIFGSTDGAPVTRSSPLRNNVVVAVYDESGALLRVNEYGNVNSPDLNVDTDPHNNILIAGSFSNTLSFGALEVSAAPAAMAGSFFAAKLSPTGVPLWLKSNNGDGISLARDACFDLDSNCCILGEYGGTLRVESMEATARGVDVFLLKYKPSGSLDGLFNMGSSERDNGTSVCVGVNNQLLITGDYGGTVGFSGSALTYPVHGRSDLFILNLNPAFGINWFAHSDDVNQQTGYAIAADADAIAVVGATRGAIRFGSTTFSPAGNPAYFLAVTGY